MGIANPGAKPMLKEVKSLLLEFNAFNGHATLAWRIDNRKTPKTLQPGDVGKWSALKKAVKQAYRGKDLLAQKLNSAIYQSDGTFNDIVNRHEVICLMINSKTAGKVS